MFTPKTLPQPTLLNYIMGASFKPIIPSSFIKINGTYLHIWHLGFDETEKWKYFSVREQFCWFAAFSFEKIPLSCEKSLELEYCNYAVFLFIFLFRLFYNF